MNECLNCKQLTSNPKYCCRSCSASANNRLVPKRLPEGICKDCNEPTNISRLYCKSCWQDRQVDWNDVTYGEVMGARLYQKNSRIRDLARRAYRKSTRPKHCANCGYDKHYEVCHIAGISEHPPDTPVSTINDLSNLIALCPNCHWELDRGELTIDDIRTRRLP